MLQLLIQPDCRTIYIYVRFMNLTWAQTFTLTHFTSRTLNSAKIEAQKENQLRKHTPLYIADSNSPTPSLHKNYDNSRQQPIEQKPKIDDTSYIIEEIMYAINTRKYI